MFGLLQQDQIWKPIDRALAWWAGRLNDVLPASWRRGGTNRPPQWAITRDHDLLVLSRLKKGEYVPLAYAPFDTPDLPRDFKRRLPRGATLRLRIAPGLVLTHMLEMPLAAESAVSQVIPLQMERYLPIKSALAHFDYRIAERQSESGRLRVEVAVIKRNKIDPLMEGIRRDGFQVDQVDVGGSALHSAAFNFSRPEIEFKKTIDRRVQLGLALLFVMLFVAGAQLLAMKRANDMSVLQSQIEKLTPRIEQSKTLVRNVATLTAGQSIAQAEQSDVRPLRLLQLLNANLPDDIWLNALEFSRADHSLRLSGSAPDATAVLPLLEATGMLQDAKLDGPIMKDPRGFERFEIKASIKKDAP